jgi:hypothetical protein
MSDSWVSSRSQIIRQALGDARDEVIIVAPDMATLRAISLVQDVEWPRHVRLLTAPSQIKQLKRDFFTGTYLADLIDQGKLEIKTIDTETLLQPLLITSDTMTCLLLSGQEDIAAVQTDEEEVFHFVRGEYLSMWGSAQSTQFKTPAYSQILQTIGEDFDSPMETDAATMLQSSVKTRALEDQLDEIHAFILLAAKNGQQYKRLTKWGERIGLGSPGRFSTRKRELEKAGLIISEKVETESVGRPRQRLLLADSSLKNASIQDIITAAQSVLPT